MSGTISLTRRGRLARKLGEDPVPLAYRLVIDEDMTLVEVGKQLGVGHSTIRYWIELHEKEMADAASGATVA